jgi:hypothetical protein
MREKNKTAADAFHHSIGAPWVWTWNPKASTWIMVRKKFNMQAHLYLLEPGNTHCNKSSASSITGLVVGCLETKCYGQSV